MITFITAQIADTLVTLVSVTPLVNGEPISYQLLFRDLPTGETNEIHYASEEEGVKAFAAWLCADEIAFSPKAINSLYEHLGEKSIFLP